MVKILERMKLVNILPRMKRAKIVQRMAIVKILQSRKWSRHWKVTMTKKLPRMTMLKILPRMTAVKINSKTVQQPWPHLLLHHMDVVVVEHQVPHKVLDQPPPPRQKVRLVRLQHLPHKTLWESMFLSRVSSSSSCVTKASTCLSSWSSSRPSGMSSSSQLSKWLFSHQDNSGAIIFISICCSWSMIIALYGNEVCSLSWLSLSTWSSRSS